MDTKSYLNLKKLDMRVTNLTDVLSPKYHDKNYPNNDADRQELFSFIMRSEHGKASGKLVRHVFRKHHVMSRDTYAYKVGLLIKHNPTLEVPLSDMINGVKSEFVVSKVPSPSHSKDRALSIPLQDGISNKVAKAVAHDFLVQLHKLLPKSDYTSIEKYGIFSSRLFKKQPLKK